MRSAQSKGDRFKMPVVMEIEVPSQFSEFRLPEGLNTRLQDLLDRQDGGEILTPAERKEAEDLVDLADWLSLMRLRARRLGAESTKS